MDETKFRAGLHKQDEIRWLRTALQEIVALRPSASIATAQWIARSALENRARPRARRGPKPKYPWAAMHVGDSFLYYANERTPAGAYTITHLANKRYAPKRFSCHRQDDAFCISRVL